MSINELLELNDVFGKGFSRTNLQNMRALYLNYEKCQSLTSILTWTHYCELLSISDNDKQSFYEKEAICFGRNGKSYICFKIYQLYSKQRTTHSPSRSGYARMGRSKKRLDHMAYCV